MTPGRPAGAAALAALALAGAAASPARAADPAEAALRASDVYVSPRALGPAAPQAESELRQAASRLADERRPAKLAVVAGPAGAPSMLEYARRLAAVLGYEGTLVVTAPRRAVAAVGPLAPAVITRRLRAERVGAIADPTDRVVRAAQLAAPPPVDDEGSGAREALILLGLAGLGAAWAVAWGTRREARRERDRMLEARAAATVRLDAIEARAADLAERAGRAPAAQADVERARAEGSRAAAALRDARSLADVERAGPPTREALAALGRAAQAMGDEVPADDPFAGLCGVDPAHGRAVDVAEIAGGGGPIAVCAGCRDRAAAGQALAVRTIPHEGRPVPYRDPDDGLGRG